MKNLLKLQLLIKRWAFKYFELSCSAGFYDEQFAGLQQLIERCRGLDAGAGRFAILQGSN
jgi:hypothetical protein